MRSDPSWGSCNININRMHVGQEADGERNIIFLQLDTPLTPEMVAELGRLKTIKARDAPGVLTEEKRHE